MTRAEAKEFFKEQAEQANGELKEAYLSALSAIHSMELMRDDVNRLKRDLSNRLSLLRTALTKQIDEQEKIPSWSFVRGLKFAQKLVEEHLTRIDGLMEGEEEHE